MAFTMFQAGPETRVNTTTVEQQEKPKVAKLADGG